MASNFLPSGNELISSYQYFHSDGQFKIRITQREETS